ncbi:CRISPR-associated endonuclease Cas2 [Agrilactobacillus yilanensis]|uniref:CRISPR-associated endoribonuclease Cas2 n=1 Tax=Agrilactobacillus yilanensis TaxID=2485997 RepID=A0ABW4J5L6_9LACO|nr:CRISPR-associated endonuclease Cas2 [Agrilactobacillus yilanensis]
MLIVVGYDISLMDPQGAKRLRHAAKICDRYGQRVQNSVFECLINTLEFEKLQRELKAVINPEVDSLRFYNLGQNYETKVKHVGAKAVTNMDQPMIF